MSKKDKRKIKQQLQQ